jgi:predicted phosphodiesterase
MKIIAIGDLHGKNIWKKAVKKKADFYIFMGDYLGGHN